MFPFKWDIESRKNMSFSDKTSIKDFKLSIGNLWENIAIPKTDAYQQELFNEKNFFYQFAHRALYDDDTTNNIIRHYERREPYEHDVVYKIHVVAGKEDIYSLLLKSICLDLYETGVGVMSFYLENYNYPELEDVLRISEFGRRISPPFFEAKNGIAGTKQIELAESISIEGLNGNPSAYFEDFNDYRTDSYEKPARFITKLISDFSEKIAISSVIDERMFVICWYGNNELSEKIKSTKSFDEFKLQVDWYRFLFVDSMDVTCKNQALREKLIKKHTYSRWQEKGILYGFSRYSLVFLSDLSPGFLLTNFRTIYVNRQHKVD